MIRKDSSLLLHELIGKELAYLMKETRHLGELFRVESSLGGHKELDPIVDRSGIELRLRYPMGDTLQESSLECPSVVIIECPPA